MESAAETILWDKLCQLVKLRRDHQKESPIAACDNNSTEYMYSEEFIELTKEICQLKKQVDPDRYDEFVKDAEDMYT